MIRYPFTTANDYYQEAQELIDLAEHKLEINMITHDEFLMFLGEASILQDQAKNVQDEIFRRQYEAEIEQAKDWHQQHLDERP